MDNLDFSAPRFWPDAAGTFSPELIDRGRRGRRRVRFAFHPIHLMLNSPDAETYFALREGWRRGEPLVDLALRRLRNVSFYDDLLAAMAKAGVPSV